jgi:hypothetical protein
MQLLEEIQRKNKMEEHYKNTFQDEHSIDEQIIRLFRSYAETKCVKKMGYRLSGYPSDINMYALISYPQFREIAQLIKSFNNAHNLERLYDSKLWENKRPEFRELRMFGGCDFVLRELIECATTIEIII